MRGCSHSLLVNESASRLQGLRTWQSTENAWKNFSAVDEAERFLLCKDLLFPYFCHKRPVPDIPVFNDLLGVVFVFLCTSAHRNWDWILIGLSGFPHGPVSVSRLGFVRFGEPRPFRRPTKCGRHNRAIDHRVTDNQTICVWHACLLLFHGKRRKGKKASRSSRPPSSYCFRTEGLVCTWHMKGKSNEALGKPWLPGDNSLCVYILPSTSPRRLLGNGATSCARASVCAPDFVPEAIAILLSYLEASLFMSHSSVSFLTKYIHTLDCFSGAPTHHLSLFFSVLSKNQSEGCFCGN